MNFGFHGNQLTPNLAVDLKMFELVTDISVLNLMLVSESAQFA